MKNLTFKAAMLNDSRTTVNRQSTDSQSQRHYSLTLLILLLFTLGIGQVWAEDLTITGFPGGTTVVGTDAGTVKIHSNSDTKTPICKFANSWASGANFYCIKTTGGFKSGDVVSFTGAYSNSSSKNAKFVIYAANKSTLLYTSANNVVNGRTSADDPTPESYTLTSDQDSLLFARDGNTGMFLLTLSVSRAGSDPEPTDVTAPAFVSSVPTNSATDVAVSGNIVLTFDENIANVDASKFTLSGATKGTVAIDGTDAKKVNVGYTAENEASVALAVAAEAVADAAGNKSAALSNISFTTVTAAPAPAEKDGIKMVENGALTGNFRIKSSQLKSGSYTVEGIDYTKYVQLSSSSSSLGGETEGAQTKGIYYAPQKKNVKFWFYMRNDDSSAKTINIIIMEEGKSASTKTVSVPVGSQLVSYDLALDKNAEVVFMVNSTKLYYCQIVAVESGDALLQGGEVGYVFNYAGKRQNIAANTIRTIDGIDYMLSAESKINSGSNVQLTTLGTHYIKFHLNARTKVSIECDNKPYKIGTSTSGETAQIYSGQDDGSFNLTEGDWYINGAGETVKITKLSFLEPDVAYTVTYSAGDGSVKEGKSLPTQADAVAGEKFNLASGENLERSGYDFKGWKANGTGDLLLAGAEYTMGSAAVEFVAQWDVHVAKYGVKFMDGSEKLDSMSVTLGEAPVFANPTKALYSFAGWKDGEDNDVTLSDLATSVTVEDTKLVLYAQWAKAYAADGTVNFADDNNSGALADFLPAGYACGNLDGSKNSVWGEESEGDVYFGYKLRHSGAYVELRVVADKRVTFTFGNYAQAGTIKVGDAEAATCTLTDSKYVVDTDAEAVIRFTTTSDGTVTLKSIIIGEIPAQSDDASLSDLTLKYGTDEAATISGFASTKQIYYVEAPYGTAKADLPIVGATATDATNALVTINQAKDREDWKTVIRVQAEDRIEAHDMYYEVRFKVQPKLGVEIIKAVTTTANDGDATGYIGGTYKNTKTGNAVKLDKNNHFGLVIAANNAFQEGDIFAMNITAAAGGNMGTMKIYESTDATEPLFESTEIGTVGMNYWTLPASVNGKTSLYIKRGGGDDWNPTFSSIAVYRLMAPFIESFEIAGVEDFVINQDLKTITASVANTFDVTALTPTVKYWGNNGGAIDKTGAQNFTNPVQYTVSSAYAEDATGAYAPVTYTVTITKVVPSATPNITTDPASANYYEGATIAALEVVAESAVGELSYQWQVKNGLDYEDIEGATTASYTPAISAIGSYVYRVVVTNTEESKPATSVESEDATIVIAADPSCATFVEASIPTEAPYQYTNTGEWTIYNASTSGKRNGNDQVFGNVKDFEGNTVKGFAKERCVLIFEKDMKQIRFYSANAQRSWGDTPVRVSDDVETFLGTGTPSYSEYAATTSIIQADPSNNKEQIFIADGEFLAGKCYWFAFSGSLQIFQICAVEADPLADAPVFNADLANEAICPGASFTTLDATAAPVTSYKWYKDGEVIENAEAATYTPTEAGTYYCIATNSAEGYRNASTKSKEAVLSVNAVTAITTAPQNQRGIVDAVKTLSVVAAGANLAYAWYTCDDETGANPVAVPAATEASLQVTITAGMHQYYQVVVTGDCGVESAVALVEEWALVEQADVTGYMKWDWNKTTNANAWDGVANIQLTGADKTKDTLMANTANTMPNNAYFRSDMLVTNGEYPARPAQDGGVFQGYAVKFHTTLPGKVFVTYRGTGANVNVNLVINNQEVGTEHDWHTKYVVVPAGDVTITEKEGGVLRIRSIEFVVEADHERDVVIGNMGTVCLPNPSRAFGVNVYELAGKGEGCKVNFDLLAADEVLEAGKAYVLVMTDTKAKFFYTSTSNPKTEANDDSAMKGNLSTTAIEFAPYDEAAKNVVFFKDNSMWNAYETGLRIKQYRAYLQYDEVGATTSAPAPGRRRISLDLQGQNAATGMDELNASDAPVKVLIDGQIYILRGEKMFDTTGRLVK